MDDTPPRRKRGRPRKSESQPGRGVQLRGLEYRRNQDGTVRTYVRPRGSTRAIRLPDAPENSPEFLAAYAAAVAAAITRSPEAKTSLRSMADGYCRSRPWRELANSTQSWRKREVERIVSKAPNEPIELVEARHVRADIAPLTFGVAKNRLKAWRALLHHAVDVGCVDRNVAMDVRPPRRPENADGHRPWTLAEVGQFRQAHAYGSDARLAMELAYWTSARSGDLVRMGPKMVGDDGWLSYTQGKTGGVVIVPFHALPEECGALAGDHSHLLAALRHAEGREWWLQTAYGKPRSSKSVGMWFKRTILGAGLPRDCKLHGLRATRASVLRELGWHDFRVGAWTGHKNLKEVAHYGRGARKRVLIAGPGQG